MDIFSGRSRIELLGEESDPTKLVEVKKSYPTGNNILPQYTHKGFLMSGAADISYPVISMTPPASRSNDVL